MGRSAAVERRMSLEAPSEPERSGRGIPWAITLLALAVRCLPYPEVFVAGRILFIESDAYYHLRRIVYMLTNFPAQLEFDTYLSFPSGARAI
jgi:asparagine N-glycosylation enzyme membrane subunit Stt3